MKEVARFIIFTILLSLVSFTLTNFRVQDQSYLYADGSMTEQDILELNQNKSFMPSYFAFLKSIVTLNFGSTLAGENVGSHILKRLEPTLHLALFSILTGSILGIFLGLLSVYIDKKWITLVLVYFSNLILSTPIFVVSIVILLVFFVKLNLLPPGGYVSYHLSYLLLPGFALGSRVFARIFFYTFTEGSKEIRSNYIVYLKARGYTLERIVFKHIFIKIFPILFVFILIDFSSLLSGAIIVEDIFFFPGIGKSLYYSIKALDTNLLRAILFYSGIVFYFFTRIARHIQKKSTGNLEVL